MSNKRKLGFTSSMFFIGGSSIINMVIALLTTPIITRLVAPDSFGQLSIFTMYTNLAVMFFCLGMDQTLVRFYYENNEIKYRRELLCKCAIPPLIITFICGIILCLLAKFCTVKFEFDFQIILILIINIFIGVLYRFSAMAVRLNYHNRLFAGLNIINKMSYVVFVLLLLTLTKINDFLSLIIATTGTSILVFLISALLELNSYKLKNEKIISSVISYKQLLKYGFPFIFSMGITTLFQSLDKISLNRYATYTEIGIYSSAMTLVHIFSILQTSFNTIWAPVAIEHHLQNPKDKKYYSNAFEIVTVFMFGAGITLILIKDIFALLLGSKYREAAYILPFLIFNPIMYTISETTVCGIDFEKKSKLHILIATISCLTNYIGNTLLVPILGGKGAAISTGFSYIIFFMMRTFIGQKYFNFNPNLKKFYFLTILIIIYAYYNTFFDFSIISVLFSFICFSVLIILYRDSIKWILQYIKKYI